ncbi:hypothetical protein GGP80_003115 [Salinibacter ruber]|uniref:Uncharacterized protein n=1 Tax=Salinibacter ruber TaxID=146919 RepID=A0A9X2U4Y7_9BACT|nr:hypothetical protein [Salinibacter ruber]MCS3612483.1 hypothetical protein [Salinibacter ruber]MCS3648325.1 hypothetical protein [Salinibacter ruber]MCS3665355.1 hypothetical protein [Salinibacter ruber]MCS3671844.1 hypothetical protein [Salinibacter ruber]
MRTIQSRRSYRQFFSSWVSRIGLIRENGNGHAETQPLIFNQTYVQLCLPIASVPHSYCVLPPW